jgi:hypothetical protein
MNNHIQTLKRFNAWRRGDDVIEKPTPKEIGEALDWLIEHYAAMQTELAAARAELAIAKAKDNQ